MTCRMKLAVLLILTCCIACEDNDSAENDCEDFSGVTWSAQAWGAEFAEVGEAKTRVVTKLSGSIEAAPGAPPIRCLRIDGRPITSTRDNFATWEVLVPSSTRDGIEGVSLELFYGCTTQDVADVSCEGKAMQRVEVKLEYDSGE